MFLLVSRLLSSDNRARDREGTAPYVPRYKRVQSPALPILSLGIIGRLDMLTDQLPVQPHIHQRVIRRPLWLVHDS